MRRLASFTLLLVVGCATYRDDLASGKRLYGETHYAQAMAIWRVLERDMDSLSIAERTQYAFLRGMTDYRLKMRGDARHWLAFAKANDQAHPGGLDEDAKGQLEKTLGELNDETYKSLPGSDSGAE